MGWGRNCTETIWRWDTYIQSNVIGLSQLVQFVKKNVHRKPFWMIKSFQNENCDVRTRYYYVIHVENEIENKRNGYYYNYTTSFFFFILRDRDSNNNYCNVCIRTFTQRCSMRVIEVKYVYIYYINYWRKKNYNNNNK